MCLRSNIITAFLGLALAPTAALADSVTLTADRDNTLYQVGDDLPGDQLSNGAGQNFFSGLTSFNGGPSLRRALLHFNLSSIPTNATVTSATLTLHCNKSISGALPADLHKMTADWGEGASDAAGQEGTGTPPAANDATWFYPFFGSPGEWTTAGGDFSATVSATQMVAGVAFYSWTGAGLAADAAAWVAAPSTNFGWVLLGAEGTTGSAKRFDSRASPTTSFRPMLVVQFTVPVTTTCCTAGVCSTNLTAAQCTSGGGVDKGVGISCTPNPCDQTCCTAGVCSITTTALCTGAGGSVITFGPCLPNPCPITCCIDGMCSTNLTTAQCNNGGTVNAASTCTPNPCPSLCCNGSACIANTLQADCADVNMKWLGGLVGAACNSPAGGVGANFKTPCCKANFNHDGSITTNDLFGYLAVWFARIIQADINGTTPGAGGTNITTQDLFDFLGAWFAKGCS